MRLTFHREKGGGLLQSSENIFKYSRKDLVRLDLQYPLLVVHGTKWGGPADDTLKIEAPCHSNVWHD